MDIKTLQCFVSIANTGSFTRAARLEFMSQPAISRRLTDLEQELGVKLIDRTTRRLSLTSAGQLCLSSAKKILQEHEHLLSALHQDLKNLEGSITIWYTLMMEFQMSRLLSDLSKAMPKLNIHFSQCHDLIADQALEQGVLDIVIGPQVPFADSPLTSTLDHFPFLQSQYCAVLPNRHPLSGKSSVALHELSGMPLILLGSPGTKLMEEKILEMCQKQDFAYSDLLYAGNSDQQQLMASIGRGVAFLPLVAQARALAQLCFLPISDCTMDAQYICVWNTGNRNPALPAVLHFIREWRDAFSAQHPTGL